MGNGQYSNPINYINTKKDEFSSLTFYENAKK